MSTHVTDAHPSDEALRDTVGHQVEAPGLPLVSVLIRSLGRPFLAEALASVQAQTYPKLEVVIVAASLRHPPVPACVGRAPVRLLEPGEPLSRSRAANMALDAACGDYLLFLDDDDWILPGHIERLAQRLRNETTCLAAYSGVDLVDLRGQPLGKSIDLPFDAVRQLAGNLTPIHAVLFSQSLRLRGCRFDEMLDCYEDWDFWLQVARQTSFAHLPGASAVYRIHASSGVHTDPGAQGMSSQRIYAKWRAAWSSTEVAQIMQRVWAHDELVERLAAVEAQYQAACEAGHHASELVADLSSRLEGKSAVVRSLQEALATRADAQAQQEAKIADLGQALHQQSLEAERWHRNCDALLNSASMRLTRPLRWVADTLQHFTRGR